MKNMFTKMIDGLLEYILGPFDLDLSDVGDEI